MRAITEPKKQGYEKVPWIWRNYFERGAMSLGLYDVMWWFPNGYTLTVLEDALQQVLRNILEAEREDDNSTL